METTTDTVQETLIDRLRLWGSQLAGKVSICYIIEILDCFEVLRCKW